jgi:hypothetical protein
MHYITKHSHVKDLCVCVQFLPCEFAKKSWWETPRRYLDSCGLNIDAGHIHWEGGHIHREGTKGIWVSTWTLATTCGVLELSYSGTVLLVLLKEVFVQRHYYFSWNDLLGGHSVLWNAPMLGTGLFRLAWWEILFCNFWPLPKSAHLDHYARQYPAARVLSYTWCKSSAKALELYTLECFLSFNSIWPLCKCSP